MRATTARLGTPDRQVLEAIMDGFLPEIREKVIMKNLALLRIWRAPPYFQRLRALILHSEPIQVIPVKLEIQNLNSRH